jgi:hypothetical protein
MLYPQHLKDSINKFIIVLKQKQKQFIAEPTIQQLPKAVLELMQRISQILYSRYSNINLSSIVEKENFLICFRL